MPFTGVVLLLAATVSIGAEQRGPDASPAAPPDGVVIGRVVDAVSGAPLTHAIVALTPVAAPATAGTMAQRVLTSDEGEFVFGPIAASGYRVRVTMPGYLSSASPTFNVSAHELVDGLTIRMRKGAVVSGTVTDEYGEPVIGSRVNVIRRTWSGGRAQWETVATPTTDDRGIYRLPNLQPGEYSAFVPGMRVSYPADFAATARGSGALLELNRYSTQVFPLGASGAPEGLSNSTIIGAAGSVQNERIGGFLTQTPQESRSVAPSASTMRVYPTTFAPGVPSPASARVLSVGVGEVVGNLDIQLPLVPAVTISGTIETASGPGANLLVRLGPANQSGELPGIESDVAVGVSTASGAFVLAGVPAGQYVLRASQGLWRSSLPPATIALPLAVEDKNIANLTVSLRPAVTISGRVELDGDRAKAPPSMLVLLRDNAPMRLPPQGRVDENGRFSIAAEPGTYAVSTEGDNRSAWFVKSAMTNGRDVANTPVQFTTDVTDLVLTLTDTPAGIAGTARSATGDADPLAVVLIFPVDRSLWGNVPSELRAFRSVSVDRNGAYSLKGLTPGDYFAIATTDTEVTRAGDPRFLEAAARVADRVTIRDGQIASHDMKTMVVR